MTKNTQALAGTRRESTGHFEVVSADREGGRHLAKFAIARLEKCRSPFEEQREAANRLLRSLLCATFPNRTDDFHLVRTTRGAPRLMTPSGEEPPVRISLSHCPGWVAAALTTETAVGIDIEVPRAGRDTAALAAYLGWRLEADGPAAFYYRWVLWEAYIKCTEGRLLQPAGPEFELICAAPGNAATVAWHQIPLLVATDVIAAAILRTNTPCRLALRSLDPEMLQIPL